MTAKQLKEWQASLLTGGPKAKVTITTTGFITTYLIELLNDNDGLVGQIRGEAKGNMIAWNYELHENYQNKGIVTHALTVSYPFLVAEGYTRWFASPASEANAIEWAGLGFEFGDINFELNHDRVQEVINGEDTEWRKDLKGTTAKKRKAAGLVRSVPDEERTDLPREPKLEKQPEAKPIAIPKPKPNKPLAS